MTQTMIQVRVEKDIKERVSDIYEAIGLDLPTAIRMFFKKSIMVGGLPFDGKITTEQYIVNRFTTEREESRQLGLAALKNLRAHALNRPEMTLDEINLEIDAARKDRREHKYSIESKP